MTHVEALAPFEETAGRAAARRPVRIVSPTASGRRWRLPRRAESVGLRLSSGASTCVVHRVGARAPTSDRVGLAAHDRAPR